VKRDASKKISGMTPHDSVASIERTKPRLVVIEWHDSMSYSAPWKAVVKLAEDLRKHGQDIIRTVGWIVDDTKDYVLTVGDLDFDADEKFSIQMVGRAMTIPRGCIIRMKVIKDPFGVAPKR